MPQVPNRALSPLTAEARDALLSLVSQFEGDYWSLNLNGEFEGRFDQPVRDDEGNRISVVQRSQHPDFTPNPWSKFGPNPGHVGLSFGFVQFTQDGGNLGPLLRRMQEEDGASFRRIFGDAADELVRITNLPGTSQLVPDPASRTGQARRSPRVAKVAGRDLWEPPWVDRFIEAGKHPAFQRVQRSFADARYLAPVIKQAALPFRVCSQKGLCVLLDRSVQLGPAGCARLLATIWGQRLEAPEPARFQLLYQSVHEKSWSHRMRKILDSPDISFDLQYDLSSLG
jgi:hypothetical protein